MYAGDNPLLLKFCLLGFFSFFPQRESCYVALADLCLPDLPQSPFVPAGEPEFCSSCLHLPNARVKVLHGGGDQSSSQCNRQAFYHQDQSPTPLPHIFCSFHDLFLRNRYFQVQCNPIFFFPSFKFIYLKKCLFKTHGLIYLFLNKILLFYCYIYVYNKLEIEFLWIICNKERVIFST